MRDIAPFISQYFDEGGYYVRDQLSDLINLLSALDHNKKVRVQETVLERLDRNLDLLREKLKPIVIRRKKEEVLPDLPEEVEAVLNSGMQFIGGLLERRG